MNVLAISLPLRVFRDNSFLFFSSRESSFFSLSSLILVETNFTDLNPFAELSPIYPNPAFGEEGLWDYRMESSLFMDILSTLALALITSSSKNLILEYALSN